MGAGPADIVRRFYAARQAETDPEGLRALLAADVVWQEPEVGTHMGRLTGRDAVLDMIRRAQAATGGSFRLEVRATIETGRQCAAVVEWTAERDGERIAGCELAVFRIADGLICAATFHPENLADDHDFWAEPAEGD